MADLLQRVLIGTAELLALGSLMGSAAGEAGMGRKFYPDDPLLRDPSPLPVGKLKPDRLSDAGDFIRNTLREPGLRRSKNEPLRPLDTNTLGEVPDSLWYTNRHYFKPMSVQELVRGTGGDKPPATDQPWVIYQAKLEGVTPGFRIKDSTGEKYVIKFDPKDNIELATGPDVVSSKFLFALGYNVPDNYAVRFRREQLRLGENIKFIRQGHETIMVEEDLDHLLSKVPRYPDGSYRALASRFIEGEILGPFQYYGTRADDPNDTIPHERRRVLRALYVFCAWLDHTDSRAINTLDSIQKVDGVRAVRHYLIDFGATLGSDSLIPKQAWQGHTYTIDFRRGLSEIATLGLRSSDWERMHYQYLPSVGKFEAVTFEPDQWKPSYPNPAFDNRDAADCFWAAKQVNAFSDAQIRAIAGAGKYVNPQSAEDIARVLIERRDKIARYYFARVLPLDRFRVSAGELKYDDLGGSGRYTVAWFQFNNDTNSRTPLPDARNFRVPGGDGYVAADISDGTHTVTVYLRNGKVVGVDR